MKQSYKDFNKLQEFFDGSFAKFLRQLLEKLTKNLEKPRKTLENNCRETSKKFWDDLENRSSSKLHLLLRRKFSITITTYATVN